MCHARSAAKYENSSVIEMENNMVLDQKQTSIAYRCPECGAIVRGVVGMFSLSADMIRLKCPCRGSELDIVYTKDKKVRITVPCFVCPAPHTYLISSSAFFERDIFTLMCTYSGMDICFIGGESEIDSAVAENEKMLAELVGGEESLASVTEIRRGKETLSDPQVLDIIRYVIHELREEGRIHCRCSDGGDYDIEFGDESIFVVCKKCGAEHEIVAGSVDQAYAFLNADEVTLT